MATHANYVTANGIGKIVRIASTTADHRERMLERISCRVGTSARMVVDSPRVNELDAERTMRV